VQGTIYAAIASIQDENGEYEAATVSRAKALPAFGRVVELLPDQAWTIWYKAYAFGELGAILLEDHDLESAAENHRAAIDLLAAVPTQSIDYRDTLLPLGHHYGALASILAESGAYEDAVKERENAILKYDEGLEIDPLDEGLLFSRAYSCNEMADLYSDLRDGIREYEWRREAVEYYSRAINASDEYLSAHYNRGLVYLELQEWDAMFVDFDTVLQHEPENHGAYLYRAMALARLGRPIEAENDLRKVLELTDDPYYIVMAEDELDALEAIP
jgi:tetratricopeptide (TPR) repeat protein